MSYYDYIYQNYLAHHGILGMKWGKRNGPPYPLDAEDHSPREKRLGWRRSLNSSNETKQEKRKSKGMPDKYKTALKIGAGVALAGLAVYGAYKLGAFDKLSELNGKKAAASVLGRSDKIRADANAKTANDLEDLLKSINQTNAANKSAVEKASLLFGKIAHPIKESLGQSLSSANPLKGRSDGANNCIPSSISGILRTMGINAKAKSTGGKMQNLGGIIESCFKGTKVFDGSAVKFGKSPEDAAEMLVKRFGKNAKGVVGIDWKGHRGEGHAFSWIIENGVVRFLDFQKGISDADTRKFWSFIDPNGALTIARLDNINGIDFDELSKWVDVVT